jgi:hypothetical protein
MENNDEKYEISIYKEVLLEKVAQTAGRYYRYGQERNDENLKSINIFSLENRVRNAETMQELTEISNMLLEHNLKLNNISSTDNTKNDLFKKLVIEASIVPQK